MRDRDEEFSRFVAARSPELLRLAYLLSADSSGAEDILQTALVRAYLRWDRISTNPEAYVRRIVATTVIDERRRPFRRRETAHAELPETPAGAEPYTGIDARDALRRALKSLPARQRAAVVLRHWAAMEPAQVAEVLGCSVGTVRSQTARGLEKLRAAYAETSGKEPIR
ncbi:MAG TPA: SigE family RNA polymerase sigma factor [Mycobacteriales bacterium]|nr:SigE family RNA polymerase sigma factor [Mycobacteriales bacterium]